MTATLPPESKPTSRRALLAGALGGLGALAASAIGRASPVRAGVDGDVILGAGNSTTLVTTITNTHTNGSAFAGYGTDSGTGVYGGSGSGLGVHGFSAFVGVYGESSTGSGTEGHSASGSGVAGFSSSWAGTWGQSGTRTGVYGYSGGSPVTVPAKTGVYGYAAQDNTSRGLSGESPGGHAVHGKSSTGFGGYFEGPVLSSKFYELVEIATPTTPLANHARLFVKDNGLGKTQLCVKFANGTVKVLATEA